MTDEELLDTKDSAPVINKLNKYENPINIDDSNTNHVVFKADSPATTYLQNWR